MYLNLTLIRDINYFHFSSSIVALQSTVLRRDRSRRSSQPDRQSRARMHDLVSRLFSYRAKLPSRQDIHRQRLHIVPSRCFLRTDDPSGGSRSTQTLERGLLLDCLLRSRGLLFQGVSLQDTSELTRSLFWSNEFSRLPRACAIEEQIFSL